MAYALVRPPGHHAEKRTFGGFCYFANSAIAANYLSDYGKVAILDIDYHHGNSQQDIFYHRNDVLTLSIHGHPKFAYPYFTGFKDEIGEGPGYGYNVNIALPETLEPEAYIKQVEGALRKIVEFNPAYLVIALGLDTAKADPTGTWSLGAVHFERLGELIASLDKPTVVVQEGGYRTKTLGINARRFFKGIHQGTFKHAGKEQQVRKPKRNIGPVKRTLRKEVKLIDAERVRRLVTLTGVFSEEEIRVAGELAAETAVKGETATDYSFVMIEESGELVGFTCFGRIPLTQHSYDLYWLVVHPNYHRQGIGRSLMTETEAALRQRDCHNLYTETSSNPGYEQARQFYEKAGFTRLVQYKDFYKLGDDKVVYHKKLFVE